MKIFSKIFIYRLKIHTKKCILMLHLVLNYKQSERMVF